MLCTAHCPACCAVLCCAVRAVAPKPQAWLCSVCAMFGTRSTRGVDETDPVEAACAMASGVAEYLLTLPPSLPPTPPSPAACFAALGEWDMVIDDCNWALDVHPQYLKCRVRRSQAFEKIDKTQEALQDLKAIQDIDPTWPGVSANLQRLQVIHDKKLEALKDEALGKLKDLGNSLLGNFGMSLNDFNFKQDPTTGSWTLGGSSGA